MSIDRRTVFVLGLAAGALPIWRHVNSASAPNFIFFDSRSEVSLRLASTRRGVLIDAAQTAVNLWRDIQLVPPGARVSAYTRWSDFIAVRGQLEDIGLRLTQFEVRGDLVAWGMS